MYKVRYDKVPLGSVANSVRHLPPSWLSADGLDVTDAFVAYAQPLIGDGWPEIPIEKGLQRFTRLKMHFSEKRCDAYIPARHVDSGPYAGDFLKNVDGISMCTI